MKILHITKKYTKALGGDAVVVSNLEKLQLALGREVVVLTSNCDEIISDERHYKFGLLDTSAALDDISLRRLVSLGALFFKTFSVIRKERPDVVHTHSIDMAFIASFAARWFKIPIVHTFHILTFPDPHQNTLRRNSELFLLKGAGPRLVTSPNEADVIHLKRAGVENARFLMNGVDLDFWRKAKRPHDTFTFITVGRLESQKGIEYLIRAVVDLKKAEEPFKLIIVGEGSLKEELTALANELDVYKNVEFVGRKTPEEVRDLYALCDAAVIPSLWECAPLTVFEAWAMELPLVVTKVGMFANERDSICAMLVDAGDSNALAEAMAELLADAEKRSDLIKAGCKVVQQHTWAAIADIADEMYTEARRCTAVPRSLCETEDGEGPVH